ncbi:OmpA family protein [Pedobacter sp. Hv1]|uniref:OmpA family protein n=1 Tax=Pedobacter sp. Hv1 TaxID=1740090 RepID=UPI0006D89BB5|nr:OmpA family protein [Pedobacter sp. Hv1]KQC00064.1 flagellar motor protein MotB [Pedobacter sp. Hv1]
MKKSLLSLLMSTMLLLALIQNSKAQYVLKEADSQYELYNYFKAIDLYQQAYQKRPSLHAAQQLANCFEQIRNYKETESWAAIATNMKGSKPENVLSYAKALQNNSKYTEARLQYEKYAGLDKNITAVQKSTWLLSCDSAIYWIKNPRNTVIQNQRALNTAQSDWGATQIDGSIVFASDRTFKTDSLNEFEVKTFLKFDGAKKPNPKIYEWTGNHYLHLYNQAAADKTISKLPVEVGTNYHVGSASFTADGNEMYFTLTRIPTKPVYVNGKLATVHIEIYSSQKDKDGKWTTPIAFTYNKVDAYAVGDPYISKDGKTLYFTANLPGGQGGTDLYYCIKTSSGWGQPVNLKELNTAGNERSPFFDGENTFYFSSDGWIGMGGLDIFKAQRANGQIGKPVNMGYPTNSPQDDFAYNLSSPYTGYLSSNRIEGVGNDDIYSFRTPEPIVFTLTGVAYNKQTRQPLADASIILTKTTGGQFKVQTEADGRYKFNLEKASNYSLKGLKTSFLIDTAIVTTQNLIASTELKQNLQLEPIVINKAIKIDNIYYDFDKSDIRPDAAKELDKLVKILQDNPTISIELGSHTDSQGNDNYNQKLSQSRADLAVQYIIDRGISKNRIIAKGYGETQLANKCVNGVACSLAEHQVNRRTEFKIVKY